MVFSRADLCFYNFNFVDIIVLNWLDNLLLLPDSFLNSIQREFNLTRHYSRLDAGIKASAETLDV